MVTVSCQHSSPSSSVGTLTVSCGAEPGASAVETRKPRTFAEWERDGVLLCAPRWGLPGSTLSGARVPYMGIQ